jgi:hypothetical protein
MSAPIDGDDLQSFARQLAYGSPATRQRLVEGLLSRGDFRIWALLADTVRSRELWSLRAQCLEVLGLAAARANQQTAELILTALLAEGHPPESDDQQNGSGQRRQDLRR